MLANNPYVYFECQYDNLEQLRSYKELFGEMISVGYTKFSFFDNFGQYILSVNKIDQITELLNYVRRQNFLNPPYHFYYDILAYPDDKFEEVQSIITDYNAL